MSHWEETPAGRTHCRECVSFLAWEHIEILQEGLQSATEGKDACFPVASMT